MRSVLRASALVLLVVANAAGADAPPIPTDTAARLREQGLARSRIMPLAAELTDTVGARLTGSPGYDRAVRWALATMRRLGLSDVHREDAGPFGMAWEQRRATLRLVSPAAITLPANAAPWSRGSGGEIVASAMPVDNRAIGDRARYRGRLRGRIVMLGSADRPTPPTFVIPARRYAEATPAVLGADVAAYYARRSERLAQIAERTRLKRALSAFLSAEGVRAVVLPGRSDESGIGGGLVPTDDGAMPVEAPWLARHQLPFPILYTDAASFALVARLAARGVSPRIALDLDAPVIAPERRIANVVAEIPGSDPDLRSQVVLLGAHLDSWPGGTGATDNAAGVVICLEAMRILRDAAIAPKRTVRVVLYAGEEQGLIGSRAYAERHFGTQPRRDDPVQRAIPVVGWRAPLGAPRLLPDHARLSVAINVDGGSGRIRGVFSGGNPAFAAILRDWIAPLRDLGVESVVDAPSWPADQTSFADLGLPVIEIAQDPLDYDTRSHHTTEDRYERLSGDDLAQAATVIASLVADAADAPAPMPRPPR